MTTLTIPRLRRRVAAALALALSGGIVVASLAFAPTVATAETQPADPSTPTTVSADALPTTQINGVAWSQVVVGNTVYVAGSFTTARPAGSAPGVNTVTRNNLLAYNLTTGVLINSFAPSLNAQALAITASPDGSRIYVAGDFTSIDGNPYYRLAAFSTASGAVIPSFRPILSAQARSVTATNSSVYVGGVFTSVNSQARGYGAQIKASDGSLLPWDPQADSTIQASTLLADGSKIIIGGRFDTLGGTTALGLGAVDPTTGAVLPWAMNQVVHDYGTKAAITSLYATSDRVYGVGYDFGSGHPSNLEGMFSADPATGNTIWLEDCHGDSYSVYAMNDVVYDAGHPHYCGNIGGFPQTDPWTFHHTIAFSKAATGTITNDPYGYPNWAGTPSPTLLNWFPQYVTGSYTGQGQAAWSLAGNSQYLVAGGEFPSVNGVAQQGLTRYAIASIAPNKVGPNINTSLVPAVASFNAGEARVSWTATYDQDNSNLTYSLVRDRSTNTNPIYTTTQASTFWQRVNMGFIDKGLVPGSTHTYRIFVTDPYGNSVSRLSNTVTIASSNTGGDYANSVAADGASSYWPLDEASGTSGIDHVGFNDLLVSGGVTRGTSSPISTATASTFNGSDGLAATRTSAPAPNTFSTEAWVRTTSTSGGKIIGYGNNASGTSGSYDRHTYMDNSGHITFGVYNGGTATVTSPLSYNDGQWHQVVSSLGSNGMRLWVDGKLVGSRADITAGQDFSGYWRVGGDNVGGWPNQPSSNYLSGDIGQVSIFPTVLTKQQVVSHYVASGRTSPLPVAPTDTYGAAIFNSDPLLYWRLGETSGTNAADSGQNGTTGTYYSGVTQGVSGALSGVNNTAAAFGNGAVVSSNTPIDNPTTYSLETWFKTSTHSGGKLIGFGNAQSGQSSNYDRHVYMQDDGTLAFGTYTGQLNLAISPLAYNDNAWHYVVATQSGDGMKLYVDGQIVATNPQTQAQAYTGYWRVGGDTTWNSSSPWFDGSLDEIAVYGDALSAQAVANHYSLGTTGALPNAKPVAAFSSSIDHQDATFDASASTDTDGAVASYAWDFGDGTTGTGVSPNHHFATAGSFVVKLTVTDNQGATNAVTHSVTAIAPNVAPTASFTKSISGLTATFDASGSGDSDGNVAAYAWNFGDGTTGSGLNATHTYTSGGDYTVALTVTDTEGASGTTTGPVTVIAPNVAPTAEFSSAVSDLSVVFDAGATNDPDGSIASYAWTFGDGTSGTGKTPTHTYAAGSYVVFLTVTDDRGATATVSHSVTATNPNQPPVAAFTSSVNDLSATFDAGGSSDPDGTIASYQWNFGDNQTASGATSSHVYAAGGTFTVTLTATDDKGASSTVSHSIIVVAPNQTPTAAFSTSSTNLDATFDASASADPDGTIASYGWDFGDGTTGTGATTSHTFTSAGSFVIILTVTDDRGATNTVSHSITVTKANIAPTAAFTSTTAGATASFSAADSVDPDGTIASYSWIFGDGTTGTGVAASHDYATTGSYPVTLTVTDGKGATGQITHTVSVVAANAAPVASFTGSANNLAATFDGSTSTDSDGSVAGYSWNFGDGSTGNGASVSHTFLNAGTYGVTLTVTDNQGATGTLTKSFVITAAPAAGTIAQDAFARAVSSGWGTADIGGQWTITGAASNLSVANGVGKVTVPGGSTRIATLATVSSADTDVQVQFSQDSLPSAGGSYTDVIGRKVGSASYDAEVIVKPTGTVTLVLEQGSTALKSLVVPGLTYTPGSQLQVRVQTTGTSPTTIRAKVWLVGQAEPTTWQVSTTDSAAALQTAGAVGLSAYLAGTATGSVATSFDNFVTTSTTAPPVANQAPIAAFTANGGVLSASFDGTSSTDPDGSLTGYSWNFGDGSTGTGPTTSHSYANPGTVTVALTVTDNQGATSTVSHPVTVTAPVANRAPVAVFSSGVTNLSATFDGSGSNDPDGTVAGYAWNFGDGTSGTGASVSHSYATAGTFTVTLTVTDDKGATGVISHTVTTVAPPANVIAQDDFERALISSWGSAIVGGAWTNAGAASAYSVVDGAGQQVVPAGSTKTSSLSAVSSTNTDLTATFTTDKAPTGGGIFISGIGRDVGTTNYQARIWIQANGVPQVQLLQGGTTLKLANIAGISYTPGTVLQMRLQVFGTSPTTIRARTWVAGQPEPTTWQVSSTDSTPALQVPGSVALRTYLSGTATAAPVTVRFDGFSVAPQ